MDVHRAPRFWEIGSGDSQIRCPLWGPAWVRARRQWGLQARHRAAWCSMVQHTLWHALDMLRLFYAFWHWGSQLVTFSCAKHSERSSSDRQHSSWKTLKGKGWKGHERSNDVSTIFATIQPGHQRVLYFNQFNYFAIAVYSGIARWHWKVAARFQDLAFSGIRLHSAHIPRLLAACPAPPCIWPEIARQAWSNLCNAKYTAEICWNEKIGFMSLNSRRLWRSHDDANSHGNSLEWMVTSARKQLFAVHMEIDPAHVGHFRPPQCPPVKMTDVHHLSSGLRGCNA